MLLTEQFLYVSRLELPGRASRKLKISASTKDYALKVYVETQKVDVETRVMASCLVSLVVANVYVNLLLQKEHAKVASVFGVRDHYW